MWQRIKNFFTYIPDLIKEISIKWKYRKAGIELQETLEANGFRVDWIGRIYTVINVPEDLMKVANSQMEIEGFVLSKITEMSPFFMKLGLADYSVPSFERISDGGAYAFLVSMYPDTTYGRFWKFILHSVGYVGLFFTLKIFFNFLVASGTFTKIGEFFSTYL